MQYLATQCPSSADALRLIDATPVPGGTSRQTVKRSEFGGLGELRLLRRVLPLLPGLDALSDHHPRGYAAGLVPGRPETRRTEGHRGVVRPRPRTRGTGKESLI